MNTYKQTNKTAKTVTEKKIVYMGCDPAIRKNGMAVFIKESPTDYYTIIFKNLRHFQKWIDGLMEDKAPEYAIVGVEVSENDIIFEGHFQSFLKVCKAKDSRGMRNKYAMSVGKNMAATQYVIDLFKEKYKPRHVFEITAKEKGAKLNERDLHRNYGIQITGSEQDERDAAVICEKAIQKYKFNQKIKLAKNG
jgi:hypothetical protein